MEHFACSTHVGSRADRGWGADDLGFALWMKYILDEVASSNACLFRETTVFEHHCNLVFAINDDGISAPVAGISCVVGEAKNRLLVFKQIEIFLGFHFCSLQ